MMDDRAFRVVGHVEQRSIWRQRAAPWFGADIDCLNDAAPLEIHYRDGAADAIGDIRKAVVWTDRYARGSSPTPISAILLPTSFPLLFFT